MEYLWLQSRAATVREVQGAVDLQLAYTTLMTTLDRLHKKGFLDRRREGRAFVYATRVSRAEFHGGLLQRLLRGALGSGGSAAPVLSTLVDTVGEHDRALLDQLEKLVRRKRTSPARSRGPQ